MVAGALENVLALCEMKIPRPASMHMHSDAGVHSATQVLLKYVRYLWPENTLVITAG